MERAVCEVCGVERRVCELAVTGDRRLVCATCPASRPKGVPFEQPLVTVRTDDEGHLDEVVARTVHHLHIEDLGDGALHASFEDVDGARYELRLSGVEQWELLPPKGAPVTSEVVTDDGGPDAD